MNILFISDLNHDLSAGPSWSIPAAVDAQSKIDNVLWVDLSNACLPHWKNVSVYHNIKEYGKLSLSSFPKPFDRPDVVVFEGFYKIRQVVLSWELRYKNIPYIVVPRCSLTRQALNNHSWLKKRIAHWLVFNSFARHARAIQYLTTAEYNDSTNRWNEKYFIIPNGFNTPSKRKEHFSKIGIKAIFIGRIDIYQKGLDLLLDACVELKNELRYSDFRLSLYGPRTSSDYPKVEKYINDNGISDLVQLNGEILEEAKEKAILDADIMFLTSRFEGHPMGLIEALAYGLPCLITRGANMLDVVSDADAGWCCETNTDDIKKVLLQLISERHKLDMKGANAYHLAKSYDWSVLAKLFHDNIVKL